MSAAPMINKTVTVDRCRLLPFAGGAADISGQVSRIDIYENLFSPVLTGKVMMQDSSSLTTRLGMFGADVFSLQFSVYDAAKNAVLQYGNDSAPLLFMAYRQSNRVPFNFAGEAYELNLASAEMFSSAGIKISRSFKNMRVEEIIRVMLERPEYIATAHKKFYAQTTTTPVNMVAPYMSPLEIIRLATLMAQGEQETNFLFYETLKGFHFKSIRQLVKEGSSGQIPTITRGVSGLTSARSDLNVITADQIHIVVGYDLLGLSAGGYFASATFGLDVLSGRMRKTVTRASKMSPIVNPTGAPNYPAAIAEMINPTSRIYVVPTLAISAKDAQMTSLDPTIYDNKIEQNIDGRARELMALNTRVVRVRMAGVPNIHAGSIVNIVVPTPENNNKKVVEGRDVATGRYLVVAVTHSLVAGPSQGFVYETTIEACSDSIL